MIESSKLQTFISYSHHDKQALDRLHVHLANLQREGLIDTWFDREILAGDAIDDEIIRKLDESNLFLLLLSPDFIASDYCIESEMGRALERHETGLARVVPIIVEPCDWISMQQLRRLKAVPVDGKPISEWTNPNNAYLNVVQELRKIITANAPSEIVSSTIEPIRESTAPRYRVKRDFDEIDRTEFRNSSLSKIKEYFRRAISEISMIDGLRGSFDEESSTSFSCIIVNNGKMDSTAHISIYCKNSNLSIWDICYSFQKNSPIGSANGGYNVSSDEYEQFLAPMMSMSAGMSEQSKLSPEQAAEQLWNQFIEKVGITYA